MTRAIKPGDWTECGDVAVRTKDITLAARVAALRRGGGRGFVKVFHGGRDRRVEWMRLGVFRRRLEPPAGPPR